MMADTSSERHVLRVDDSDRIVTSKSEERDLWYVLVLSSVTEASFYVHRILSVNSMIYNFYLCALFHRAATYVFTLFYTL